MAGRSSAQRTEEPLGLAAFASLRAEDEPWLEACFVPPDDFDLLGGMCSVAVFGPPGSGKSAVREILTRQYCAPAGDPACVLARWQPVFDGADPAVGFRSVPGQVAYVFDACALAIVEHLAAYPQGWAEAPGWARSMVTWFVHRFARSDLHKRVGALLARGENPGADVVKQIWRAEPEEDLVPPHNWLQVTTELSKALEGLGLAGLWVVVDGLEPLLESQREWLASALTAFFSTLPLFEAPALVYKAFLPQRLQPALAAAAGSERRRIQGYLLRWREAQLVEMVERRLALAVGRQPFGLHDLCAADGLLEWLRRGGGDRPRDWLELVRPLVVRYLAQSRNQPIDEQEWRELRRQSPPRLHVDDDGRILVGGREIPLTDMTSGGHRLLCYLYRNAGRVVPWQELYYRGYREMDRVPGSEEEEGYEDWCSCERTLHTRMSDVRQAIEPDPKDPLYLETVKGKGVILNLRW